MGRRKRTLEKLEIETPLEEDEEELEAEVSSWRTKTVASKLCPVIEIGPEELERIKSEPTGFYNLIQSQTRKSEEAFKIVFTKDCQLQYDELQNYFHYPSQVDDADVFEYEVAPEDALLFNRKLPLYSPYQSQKIQKLYTTEGNFRVWQKLTESALGSSRTVENISKLVPDECPMPEVTPLTTMEELDGVIRSIASRSTVNVANIGMPPDLVTNRDHPFYPPKLVTPDKYLDGSNSCVRGVFSPYYYFSFARSHTPMHIECLSLASLNVLVAGADKEWTCVPKRHCQKLWDAVQRELRGGECEDDCSAFMRRKGELITHEFLARHKIKFTVAIQKAGEIMITPPNCSHQVFCTGRTVNHSVNFADNIWCYLTQSERYFCPQPRLHNFAHGLAESNINSSRLGSLFLECVDYDYGRKKAAVLIFPEVSPTKTETKTEDRVESSLGRRRKKGKRRRLAGSTLGEGPNPNSVPGHGSGCDHLQPKAKDKGRFARRRKILPYRITRSMCKGIQLRKLKRPSTEINAISAEAIKKWELPKKLPIGRLKSIVAAHVVREVEEPKSEPSEELNLEPNAEPSEELNLEPNAEPNAEPNPESNVKPNTELIPEPKAERKRLTKRKKRNLKSRVCEYCNLIFARATTRDRHMRNKHDPNKQKISCSRCAYKGNEKDDLARHMRRKHALESLPTAVSPKKVILEKKSLVAKVKGPTAEPNRKPKRKPSVVQNTERNILPNAESNAEPNILPKPEPNAEPTPEPSPESIPEPNLQPKRLNKKKKRSQNSRVCEYCNLIFARTTTKIRHMRNKHDPKKKKIPCNHCAYKGNEKDDLARHMRRKHSNKPGMKRASLQIPPKKLLDFKTIKIPNGRQREKKTICKNASKIRLRIFCVQCDYECNERKDLFRHMRLEHGKEMRTICRKDLVDILQREKSQLLGLDPKSSKEEGRLNNKDGRPDKKEIRFNNKEGRSSKNEERSNNKEGKFNMKVGGSNKKEGISPWLGMFNFKFPW